MKLLPVILLVALCGCCHTKFVPVPIYYDSGGAVHACANPKCWEVERQFSYFVAALTAVQTHPERAAYISDKALADYWKWADKINEERK
jgi:hypothetical protein